MNATDTTTGIVSGKALEIPEHILWAELHQTRAAGAREQLINLHSGLAKSSALHLLGRLPGLGLEARDFTQTAMTGLIEAVDRFDPTAGVAFAAFARKRIRGALLNELPKETELTAQLSFRRRVLRDRTSDLADMGTDVFAEMVDLAVGLAVGFMLEDSGMYAAPDAEAIPPTQHGERNGELKLLAHELRSYVADLRDDQQVVIRGHYLEGLAFKSIADQLKVSRARVSQLHKAGLAALRSLIGRRSFLDVSE